MIFISCIKELNIFLGCSECRIHPYGNLPFFVSELLLLGIALSFYIDKFWPKLCLIMLCTISLIILQGRAAIIASFFGLFVLLYFPYLKKNLYKFTSWFLLALLLFISLVIFNFLINNTSLGSRDFSTLSGRLFMYELSINSIKDNPFFGIGFQVTPNYYNFINHNHNVIHNFFLRIATENGLIVLFFVLSFILVSFLKMIKNNDFVELSFLISFIIYNSLSTRHLSLNLFNILFYIILTRSFYSKHQIKS